MAEAGSQPRRDYEAGAHLELDLGAPDVALKQLVSAGGTFSGLINEVARAYTGVAREAVTWIVEVKPGSVRLPLRAEPASEEVAPSAIPELFAVIAEGVACIDAKAERPDFFTDRALEQAKALANLAGDDLPIRVRNGRASTTLSKRLMTNVDEVLGAPLESYGTVEGTLEGFNLHAPRPVFAVYEPLTGHRVDCHFTASVTVDDLRPAIGKRVGVRGPIKTRPSGVRISVEAETLYVFPDAPDLPGPDEVVGILNGYE